MKKASIVIFVFSLVCVMVYTIRDTFRKESHQEPYIFHLRDTYNRQYYVYPNFKDEYKFIKYLFDFANKHPGTIDILTNENDVCFEGIHVYWDKPINHFFFPRQDSINTKNEFVVVNYLDLKDVDFQIEIMKPVSDIVGKKLKCNFDKINLNIVQNFLNYSDKEDFKTCRQYYSYIYELYDCNDNLIIRQEYSDHGKHFTIEMY